MAADQTLNKEYLPVPGLPDYRSAATKLLLGADSPAIAENRVRTDYMCSYPSYSIRVFEFPNVCMLGNSQYLRFYGAKCHSVLGCHVDTTLIIMHETPKVSALTGFSIKVT